MKGTAACTAYDPDMWFPNGGPDSAEARRAKAICATCVIRVSCLDDALQIQPAVVGIWGGEWLGSTLSNSAQRKAGEAAKVVLLAHSGATAEVIARTLQIPLARVENVLAAP